MSGRDEWPSEQTAVTRVDVLPGDERTILAALAIVGRASLSTEELAALVEVDDVRPLVADLERRGLLRRDEKRRLGIAGRLGADIRKLNGTLETADRLMGYVETLAQGGRLTAARLEDDAEAILGIAAWGAEVQQWARVLEFVKTVQASFALAERVHEQRVLLELGRTAASRLGDRTSELWCLRQLMHVADHVGDVAARVTYADAADALVPASRRAPAGRAVLSAALVVIAGSAGALAGYLVGHNSGGGTTTSVVTTTRGVTETITGNAATDTVTTTLPAETVTSATTETVTATSTTLSISTLTVTTTAPIK
jgi:hypothetical protein